MRGLGLETTPYAAVEVGADNAAADARIGRPAVLKTQTLGYDGKGQVVLDGGRRPAHGLARRARRPAGDPGSIRTHRARGLGGRGPRAGRRHVASFDSVENRHVNGILDVTLAPAGVPPALAETARAGRRTHRPSARSRGRALRRALCHRRRPAAGQRDRPPRPQLGPLDHRGLRDQPVCAAHPCRLRPASRLHGKAGQRLYEEPDRRRRRALAGARRRPDRALPPLRQGGNPRRPQDGPRHLARPPRRTACRCRTGRRRTRPNGCAPAP